MNVLLIRCSAIGDVVMASGLIPAIKTYAPNASISWLVEPSAALLLRENPAIDHVIIWDKNEWKSLWKQKKLVQLLKLILSFRKDLRSHNFSIVLDVQGLFKSSFLGWLSGAKRRVGLGRKEGSWLFNTETIDRGRNDAIMCSEYIELAVNLGFAAKDFVMSLPYSPTTELQASQLLKDLTQSKDYIFLCPFTTRPQKHWFDEHWIQLIAQLNENYRATIIVLGGPSSIEHANLLVHKSSGILKTLVGKTNLLHAVALIDNAKLIIGVDTGLTHIGIAKNTPTIAMFGSTRPYLKTPAKRAKVLYQALPCSPCRRRPTCDGGFSCMKEINCDMVIQAAEAILP